jgi:Flp pilus assembly pilin Flp
MADSGLLLAGRFLRETRAATLIEYTLLIGLLAAVAIFVVVPVFNKVEQRFLGLQTALNYKPTSGPIDHNAALAQVNPQITNGVKNDATILTGGGTTGGGTSGGGTTGGGTTGGGSTSGSTPTQTSSSSGVCDASSFRNHGQYQACLAHSQHHGS